MKKDKKGILKSFMLTMVALGISLVLLWVVFYYLTVGVVRSNLELQAETGSEAIIENVEEELLELEDSAYLIGNNKIIADMAVTTDLRRFFEMGSSFVRENTSMISGIRNADNIVVFNKDGQFYRIKGTVSNTALKRIFYMMKNGDDQTLTVTSNKNTYIGLYKPVFSMRGIPDENSEQENAGYIALLMEQSGIERLISPFSDMDYLGTALFSGNRLLCSSNNIKDEDMEELEKDSVFVKDKEIGLSGYRLTVYSMSTLSESVSRYFRIIMPITVLILGMVVAFFIGYLRRHMIDPINKVVLNTQNNENQYLPYTGEQYFDGLVDHVNDMMNQIKDREKALYDSEVKIKKTELEKETTLMLLLKKQISAHFTVNTMNVVRALINRGEKEAAARICDELSTLLRYANAGDKKISLLEEFFVLEQYVGIMQARFPGKIEADIDEEDSLADIFIPRMLIQPIVENAIIHGLAGEKGKVMVYAVSDEETVTITVVDDGKGMDEETLRTLIERIYSDDQSESDVIEHVALRNIQKRIRMVCGTGYGISIESSVGAGTTVSVKLPIENDASHRLFAGT